MLSGNVPNISKRLKQKQLLMVYMMGEATPKKSSRNSEADKHFFAQTFVDIVYRDWSGIREKCKNDK